MKMTVKQYDSIVVGLGAAGVTAASVLAKAGKRVLGLEAQDRIGGRVKTFSFSEGVVELGAEWIHGENPNFVHAQALKNNVKIQPQNITLKVFRSDGCLADPSLFDELMRYCNEIDKEPEKPEPLGEYVTRKLTSYLKCKRPELLKDKDFLFEFLEFMNLAMNNYEASNDWNDVNVCGGYEELEGHQHLSWHMLGYETFFDILLNNDTTKNGLSGLDIKLNAEVIKIKCPLKSGDQVTVWCKNGTIFTSSSIIITVSAGVLKEKHANLFVPSLPAEKVTAIENIPMGCLCKIILFFHKPWWPRNQSFFGFLWRKEDKKTVAEEDYWTTKILGASCSMGSDNTLTLWTNGDIAKMVENMPEDVVQRKSMDLFRRFMGNDIPNPTGIVRSKWYSNPHTRGSYTFDGHDVALRPSLRASLAEPLLDSSGSPRVLFAGEATSGNHYATVHGACETGQREAKRLLTGESGIKDAEIRKYQSSKRTFLA